MHDRKTCCLEQSDGHNFALPFSQRNAEKKKIRFAKVPHYWPKYRLKPNVSQTSCPRCYYV